MTSHRVPEQSESHVGLLDEFSRAPAGAKFDAILVPTYRPVERLDECINLARETRIPLIVVCSKNVRASQVIERAARDNVEALAFDLPPENPLERLELSFATSTRKDLAAASPGWTRDLSMKRNLGLILARLLGWTRLMFLDDDIYGIEKEHVDALASALDDHSVSALIPEQFPDNSVACHAHRLGGGDQKVFASASGIGIRCDRDDLPFFPNIYNEDWFFFAEEAASHKIAKTGVSWQLEYDPYDDPNRAAQEEFGDLLAEGLYARLDIDEGIQGVDIRYWTTFIERRMAFHRRVTEALKAEASRQASDREFAATATEFAATATKARKSLQAAQDQLATIKPELCQIFVESWQLDLTEWRSRINKLQPATSTMSAFRQLGLSAITSQ